MLRRPCGRAMRSKGRVGVDAVASKPGVAKEVLPLTRRILRLRLLKGGSWVSTTPCRTHGLKSGACRRPETERQSLSPRLSHDSRAAFREFVTHDGTARPPQFDYRDPRGPLHAPRHSVASPIRGSNRPESPRRACPQTLLRDKFCSPQPWQLRARASSIRRRRHLTPRAGQRHQPLTARPNLPSPRLQCLQSSRTSLLQRMQRQHHVRGRADWRTCMPSHAPHSPPAWIDQLTAPPAPTTACRVMKPLGRRGAPRRHRAPRRSAETGLRLR